MSEETKKKMSLSAKGKPKSEEARKNMSLARKGERVSIKTEFKKGRIVTDEIKRKISEALKGKKPTLESRIKNRDSHLIKNINKTNKVDDSKVWRKKVEYRLWREAVFSRDNYTCQKCNSHATYLHPHHIKNFSKYIELRFAIDNGITFCKDCHKEFHHSFGTRNNNQEQVDNFFKK